MKAIVLTTIIVSLFVYAIGATVVIEQLRTQRWAFALGYQGDGPNGTPGLWSRIRVTPEGLVRCAKADLASSQTQQPQQ